MELKRILQEIHEIEKLQQARWAHSALSRYNKGEKVHKKQLEFHKSLCRNRWVFGGNRSGKTECGAVEACWMARGEHPYRPNRAGASGWVVSVSYEVQREVAQAKILNYLNPLWIEDIVMEKGSKGSPNSGIIDTIYIKNAFGSISKIGFKSCDQGREKFAGASLDFVWFDEEPPYDIYEECKMRVLDKKGDLFGTMTPLKGLSWVYDEIYLNKHADREIFTLTMEWADNPFLDKEEIEQLSRAMSGESLESRRYGRFSASQGLVYPEFEPGVHVIEPFYLPPEWQSNLSIDPGLNNPLSCHFYGEDYDGNIYVVAEHYERGRDIDYHADAILKLADLLDWKRNSNGMLEALIDSAAGQRTLAASKSVVELFFERGIAVNPRVNKELFSGIATVRRYFAARPAKIFIFKTCPNMIREIKSYWWDKGDCPIKRDDHAMDELRYYLMSRPENQPKKPAQTLQARYKDKLIKAARRERRGYAK
ncbi:MAG: terminase large subunit domain-containing protein [Christensenellales bacterium]|jgi:phage terminase large subunit-like protein